MKDIFGRKIEEGDLIMFKPSGVNSKVMIVKKVVKVTKSTVHTTGSLWNIARVGIIILEKHTGERFVDPGTKKFKSSYGRW